MPKMKTKRSTAKRFKVTATGKLVRHHAYHSHILTHKTTKQKRRLRKAVVADATVVKELKRCMPYA
ncbi:MAG: 50S ribosomal protein L35 [Proteobacteria bacterium]|jgi:large subunit ribosomal protein L35|nr:50S ribosomal protein L35 [Pseudomonadota bacterium]